MSASSCDTVASFAQEQAPPEQRKKNVYNIYIYIEGGICSDWKIHYTTAWAKQKNSRRGHHTVYLLLTPTKKLRNNTDFFSLKVFLTR